MVVLGFPLTRKQILKQHEGVDLHCRPKTRKRNGEHMRVIIAGGRDVRGAMANNLVEAAISACGWEDEITEVVHGDAVGIDTAADHVCSERWSVIPVPAEWDKYGKSAGPIRNKKMADMADALIAIWDGGSRGTKNMIQTAERNGLRVFVYRY